MSCNTIMSAPVCLIETDVNGLFCVRKEAKNILDGIKEPVVVVSVVGLYRTGKSYLMNRLAGQQSGFALGNTIESKTKGIWMWCVPHPTKPRHALVLLDTEGLGDVDKGDEKHDTWIFCLALLLSSTLVYNSLGVIDNMALEKLHYVSELREHICLKAKAKNTDESGQYMSVFPAFVWTVRDFYLDLERDNTPITADQYLEGALELKAGTSAKIAQHNLPRRCLRNFFVTRKCFVFPRPASPKDMKRMEVLTEAELDPEFLEQSKDFCKYIYHSAQSKTIAEGCVVTGNVLANLTEVYVEAIRSGSVPCLENAVISLSKIHNAQAVDEALQIYVKEMLKSLQLPVDLKQLSQIHKISEKKAIKVFIRMSFNDKKQTYQRKLAEAIQKHYEDLCEQNKEASRNVCRAVLHRVFEQLENGLHSGYYMKPGGNRQFRDLLTKLATSYRSETKMQIMSEEVLNKYWKDKEEAGMMILAADESLTAAEHEKQVEKLKNDVLEQQQRSLVEQNRLQMQMHEDQRRTQEEHMRQLMEKTESEHVRARMDHEKVMDAKLKEQEAMLISGYKEDANRLHAEIDRLQKKQQQLEEDSSSCCIL